MAASRSGSAFTASGVSSQKTAAASHSLMFPGGAHVSARITGMDPAPINSHSRMLFGPVPEGQSENTLCSSDARNCVVPSWSSNFCGSALVRPSTWWS